MILPKSRIENSSQYASEGIFLVHPEQILEIANSLEQIIGGITYT